MIIFENVFCSKTKCHLLEHSFTSRAPALVPYTGRGVWGLSPSRFPGKEILINRLNSWIITQHLGTNALQRFWLAMFLWNSLEGMLVSLFTFCRLGNSRSLSWQGAGVELKHLAESRGSSNEAAWLGRHTSVPMSARGQLARDQADGIKRRKAQWSSQLAGLHGSRCQPALSG